MLAHSAFETSNSPLDCSIRLRRTVSHPHTRSGTAGARHPRHRQSEALPSRSRRFASTPRFGRGGPNLTHLIHPRRNACAFRVRDFEQSTGLFNPASPDRLSPHPHGAGQRMQSIRVTDRAKACLRGAGTSLPTPRFGRGGPCLGHLIHLRRKACAFRVRPFDPSTGLLSPTKPNHASHQRSHRTAR